MLDIIIVMIILMGAVIGFKRGFIKQTLLTVGMIFIVILSFILKNPVSLFMYKNLPFFTFNGLYENISVLNILVYELIAFFIVFSILTTIFLILLKITKVADKLIKATVILEIPSKILGFVMGVIEYYILVFISLFLISQPIFGINNTNFVQNSMFKDVILYDTPVLSDYIEPTLDVFDEINEFAKLKEYSSVEDFNCKITKVMVKNKIVTKESLDYLYSSGKIKNKCE